MPERNVYFYATEDADQQTPFDRVGAASPINALSDADWMVNEHDIVMAVLVDQVGDGTNPTWLRFLRLRDDRPYQMGRDRQPRFVDLAEDARVTEFTFMVLWPDGYMAALSSRDAPHTKYLATYFDRTSGQKCRIVDLYASDVVQRLEELKKGGLTRAEVKVRTAKVQQIEDDEQIRGFKPFWVAGRGQEAVTVKVELSVDRSRDRFLATEVVEEVQHLVSYGDLIDGLKVAGRNGDGKRDEINLKKERRSTEINFEETAAATEIYRRMQQARRDLPGGDLDHSARLN
jgi:hypothetical protein